MTAALALSDTLPGVTPRAAVARAPRRHRQDLRHRRERRRRARRRDARHPRRRGHADRRPVGLRQDDADLDPRPAAQADEPARSGSRASNVAGLGERDLPALRARNFGFVFQGFNLFPALTALENVAMAIQMKDPAREAIRAARRAACSSSSGSARARTTCRPICRAARSSASRSPARSAATRRSSSATSRPPRSTPRPRCR